MPLYLAILKIDALGWMFTFLLSVFTSVILGALFLEFELSRIKYILMFFQIFFSTIFVFFLRPWSKIYSYVNLLPLKRTERLRLIMLSNISSCLIGLLFIFLISVSFDLFNVKDFQDDAAVVVYIVFGFVCGSLSFLPYDASRNKTIISLSSLKWITLFSIVYLAMSLILPQRYIFHSFAALMGAGYIFGSLYEARILRDRVGLTAGGLLSVLLFLVLIPRLSINDLLRTSGKQSFRMYLKQVENLSTEDRDDAYFWLLRSDLSSYDFERICEKVYPKKKENNYETYFEVFDCSIPTTPIDEYRIILSSKKDLKAATDVFANLDINSIRNEHILILLQNIHHRHQAFLLSNAEKNSIWNGLIGYLGNRKWEDKELIEMLHHKDLGLNLIGLSLALENEKWFILGEDLLPKLTRIKESDFYADLLSQLSKRYLCQSDFIFDLKDFKKHHDECTIYCKALNFSCQRELYLGNSYFHAIKLLK